MIEILFVISMVICIVLAWTTVFKLNGAFPLLHLINIGYKNTYIFTPAIAFQVWFWFNCFNVI